MESEGKRYALIIANSQYQDPLLRKLVAPSQDAQGLSEVLAEPMISGFQVKSVIDAPSYQVCEEIETFFEDRDHDHLLLLYFSGHGVTDDDGLLYYATANTQSKRLRSTAISAAWVNEVMSRSLSRRQVLLLDCCHSGAFARTKSGGSANAIQQLTARPLEEGRGRFVLTASDAFQYSFGGDAVKGQSTYSVFTEALVRGLRTGDADLDGDGAITLDELYRYVHQQVKDKSPQQSPRKWESDAEGSLVVARNPKPSKAELPDDLLHAIDNLMPESRVKAIPRLERLLHGKHMGLEAAARAALIKLADDDSRLVSKAAQQCLGTSTKDENFVAIATANTSVSKQASSLALDRNNAVLNEATASSAPAKSSVFFVAPTYFFIIKYTVLLSTVWSFCVNTFTLVSFGTALFLGWGIISRVIFAFLFAWVLHRCKPELSKNTFVW